MAQFPSPFPAPRTNVGPGGTFVRYDDSTGGVNVNDIRYTSVNDGTKIISAYTGLVADTSMPFWGSPLIATPDGRIICPGFTGETYPKGDYNSVYIGVPDAFIDAYFGVQSFGPKQFFGRTPGLAEIRVSKTRAIDVKQSAGSDGATLTVHGIEPASVDITLTIWTPEQLRALNNLWPILFPPPTKSINVSSTAEPGVQKSVLQNNASAFSVQHPTLKLHGIKALTFIGASGPDPGPIARTRVFSMRAVEYFPSASDPPATQPNATTTITEEDGPDTALKANQPTPGTNKESTNP